MKTAEEIKDAIKTELRRFRAITQRRPLNYQESIEKNVLEKILEFIESEDKP